MTDGGSPRAAQDRLNASLQKAQRLLLKLRGNDFDVLTHLLVVVEELAALSASASPRVPDPARATASQPEEQPVVIEMPACQHQCNSALRFSNRTLCCLEARGHDGPHKHFERTWPNPAAPARAGRAGGDLAAILDEMESYASTSTLGTHSVCARISRWAERLRALSDEVET